ncbi:odorant receptor 22c-like, partial [Diachasmimorpha longicaudata]|uniref:odorant receptor 22c-like n=1 Tax=Diachasmimorpha longicaudata TaxID=58733 RepID=UPI0030B8A587
ITVSALCISLSAWTDRPTIIREISQTNRSRNLLLAPSCWVPATVPLSIYLLYYYLVFLSILWAVLTYVGCDAFIFNTALHICGQFEILEADIKKFNDGDDYSMQRCKIKEHSKRHNQLIERGQHMDALINIIILAQLLSNSIVTCVTGVLLLVSIERGTVDRMVMSYAARFSVRYMELFMYCYVGEKLSSHADKLRRALYDCSWYNMSKHTVKDMIFMIMRNNFSCRLTGGHFFVMNHQSFAKITRIMFSFFSVLRFMLELN